MCAFVCAWREHFVNGFKQENLTGRQEHEHRRAIFASSNDSGHRPSNDSGHPGVFQVFNLKLF